MKHYLPDWPQSLILVLVFFLASVLGAIPSVLGVELTSVTYALSMGLTLLWAYAIHLRNKKRGFVYVPVNEPRKGAFSSMVPVFLLVIIATPMLGALLEPITSLIPMSEWLQSLFEKMLDTSRPVDLVISTVILAPLCEELLCRGIICRGLLARGKPWFAIIFSAFIFALLHGNLQQGIAAFGLGIFMGWVYYKTHCLWCTIAIHFTNNALSVLMSFLFPDLPVTATYANLMPHGQYIALLVASAVLLAAIIYILYRNYKDDQSIISFKVRPAASGEALGRERVEE